VNCLDLHWVLVRVKQIMYENERVNIQVLNVF